MNQMDNNTYYILHKGELNIERFHICTWETLQQPSYIEFGFEINPNSIKCGDTDKLYLAVPFVDTNTKVLCLSKNLSDKQNCRFIFNDIVKSSTSVGDDDRDGSIIEFESRNFLTIIPTKSTCNEGYIEIEFSIPQNEKGNLYFRLLVQKDNGTIARKKSGIAKSNYVYDVKINETRNLPQNVYNIKKDKRLDICRLNQVFCFHAVKDNMDLSFVDSSNLKNIRELEKDAFKKYLPEIKSIENTDFNIVFLKDKGAESYSFFSIFTEETIGSKQIALAIGTNIFCSLLFAEASLRVNKDATIEWYKQIPVEYYIAIIALFLLVLYMFGLFKKIQKLIK